MYWECENNTFNATPTEWLQQHTLLFAISSTYRTFLLWRLHLAPPSYPGQSTTWLWLDRPSRKCTKLHTVATNNNSDPRSCSFYFCLFAPHRGVVQRWALDWTWIGLDPDWVNEKEMRHHCCENATFFKFFGPHLDLDFTVKNILDCGWTWTEFWKNLDWIWIAKYDSLPISGVVGQERVGSAFPHLFHVLLQNEFGTVLKWQDVWMCSHAFFVSTTSLAPHLQVSSRSSCSWWFAYSA